MGLLGKGHVLGITPAFKWITCYGYMGDIQGQRQYPLFVVFCFCFIFLCETPGEFPETCPCFKLPAWAVMSLPVEFNPHVVCLH